MKRSTRRRSRFHRAIEGVVLIGGVLAARAAVAEEPAADRRVHVRGGEIERSEPVVLTQDGSRVAFTVSAALSDPRFVPDPYDGKCRFIASKYTLKTSDQKEILGSGHEIPDPNSEDALVLHPFELRNAAGKFGANAVYLLLSDSENLQGQKGLHECAVIGEDGERHRGESLREVSCKDDQGVTLRFSQYAGQARYYSCPPAARK